MTGRVDIRPSPRPRASWAKSFTLDGEAVVAGADGVAVFDALHRRRKATDAMLYAFDLLKLDGEDIRPLPFIAKLARLLARKPLGIVFNEHPTRSESSRASADHACQLIPSRRRRTE
jgi:bifunctional non-homologous end joining protein LigD